MTVSSNSGQENLILEDGRDFEIQYFGDLMHHKAVVIIAPAMGVSAKFYKEVALYLQQQGFLSVLFNFTGIGTSRIEMCKSNYGMLDWAHKNMDFILVNVRKNFPNSKLIWLAHSAGGQMLGLCKQNQVLDKVVTVSSGVGYWRLNAPALKRKVHLFWHFIVPVSIFFYGYYPGKKLKIVGDLPKKAAFDWRRACMKPNYLQDIFPEFAENYTKLQAPIVAFYPTDDDMLSLASVEKLNSQFTNSKSTVISVTPEELNAKHIGHMGLLKKTFKKTFWQNYLLPALEDI